ncbi:LAGLIDADG family homing endonuclease [Streptomyces sp. NL15-2K]|uniref:LAGLIDADG family homing endonuclease n=1 Tax=Streptomyces sp. NL15-2K TaxID=376149 RepID=UPI00155ADCEC|nr:MULTISPECIES: LAGLIDADG family homing endonuclease [Actinomycetes]WKX11549.1 LAGLIDADG family homing endonuclease [Kutzneria buriramensis]
MDLTVPEYAYMFGFLQADGHLSQQSRQRGRLTVEISARDIDLLRKFQKLTPYNSSITERTRSTTFAETHRSAIWSLCSLEARVRLNELGLPYGRKSKTISPPHGEFSRRDYLRGVIDADGSVGHTSKGFPFISLTTASTAIGAYLADYAKEITGAERAIKRNARDDIYNVLYTMEVAQHLAAHLYQPGCLALERKRMAADSLATWVRPANMRAAHTRRRWTEHEDRILLELNRAKPAAETLGRTVQSCNLRLWRLRTGQVPMPSDQ